MAKNDAKTGTEDKDTSKDGGATVDAAAELEALKARNAELEDERTKLLGALGPGGRKVLAKRTGKYLAVHNYRFECTDEAKAKALQKAGASINRHKFDKDHADRPGQVTYQIMLPAPPIEGENPAYDLPDDVVEHALAAGAIEPELK